MSIVCIVAIVGLSAMGIGYGYWTDSLNIGVSVTTGNTGITAVVEGYSEGLNSEVSEDGRKLYIYGNVIANYNDSLTVKVIDNGSIPSIFSGKINEYVDNEIAEIKEQNYSRYSRYSLAEDDVIKTFEINISPSDGNTMNQGFYSISQMEINGIQDEVSDIQLRINSIEEEINGIQKEIERLNVTENHEFKYELQFEQGI